MSDYRLITDETMAANGWAAWSRDKEGKLCTSHAPFNEVGEWKDYVIEETRRGLRVFYPPGPLLIDMDRGQG
jgi:hypothetical protein